MQFWLACRRTGGLWAGLLAMGLSMAVGCHGNKAAEKPGAGELDGAKNHIELADKASAVIAAVCTRQSYVTARVGLIAGETGLEEDVFELRDPVSYTVVAYRLEETVKLEGLLRQGAEAAGRPAAQAACMRQFADRLAKLTDPLVETAQEEKKIDSSAFKNAEKEAEPELEIGEQELKPQH